MPDRPAGLDSQQGQSLAEFTLGLPVLILLVMGLLQLAAFGISSLTNRHAAQCAARTYTAYFALDEEAALEYAQAAADQVLNHGRPRLKGSLHIAEIPPGDPDYAGLHASYAGEESLAFDVTLESQLELFFPLPIRGFGGRFAWQRKLPLVSQVTIFSEKTVEREKDDLQD